MVNIEETNVVFFSFESELSTCSFCCHSLEPGSHSVTVCLHTIVNIYLYSLQIVESV